MHENLKWTGTYSGFGENVVKIEVGVVFKQEIIRGGGGVGHVTFVDTFNHSVIILAILEKSKIVKNSRKKSQKAKVTFKGVK